MRCNMASLIDFAIGHLYVPRNWYVFENQKFEPHLSSKNGFQLIAIGIPLIYCAICPLDLALFSPFRIPLILPLSALPRTSAAVLS